MKIGKGIINNNVRIIQLCFNAGYFIFHSNQFPMHDTFQDKTLKNTNNKTVNFCTVMILFLGRTADIFPIHSTFTDTHSETNTCTLDIF